MNEIDVKFYGSDDDLDALKDALSRAGFKQPDDEYVMASSSKGIIPRSITFIMGDGFGALVKDFLIKRRKCIITRQTDTERVVIECHLTDEAIERYLQISHSYNIEDLPPEPEPSNSEKEIGFHVGLDKTKQNHQ